MLRRFAVLALSAVSAIGVSGQPAFAQVDLNGRWRVGVFVTDLSLTFADVCAVTVVQTGTTVSFEGSCGGIADPVALTGSVDPQTGVFMATGSAGPCSSANLSGLATSDSRNFAGRFSCPTLGVSGGVNANRCGNGQIDPGETCDDGNLIDGDCCQSSCRPAAAGGACGDDGNPCTTDTCDAAGHCQHANRTGTCDDGNACTPDDACIAGQCVGTAQPDGTTCSDGNACTTGDRCQGGVCVVDPVVCPSCEACDVSQGCVPTISTGCKEATASSIILRRLTPDSLLWTWDRGEATTPADFGDPTTTTDYDFCVYDGDLGMAGVPGLVVSTRAAAGGDWHPAAGGFTYGASDMRRDALRHIRLTAGAAGKSRIIVREKGVNLALPLIQNIARPLTVQLKSTDGARSKCWTAVYDRPAHHNPPLFRAQHRPDQLDPPPNIVIINLDDTRADGIDRMPNLAEMAAEGVTFRNSFATNPLCAPSRASLLTGLYGPGHGVRALGGVIGGAGTFRRTGSDRRTIATWLQGAGYMTGLFGKYINGYGRGTEALQGPGGTVYVPPGWSRWRAMTSPEHFGGVRGKTYTVIDEHGVPTAYDDHTDDSQYSTDLLAAEMRAFIADAAAQGRPFMAVWTPFASHAEVPSLIPEPATRHYQFFRGMPPWRPVSYAEADVSDKPRHIQELPQSSFNHTILNDAIRVNAYATLLSVDEQLRVLRDDLVQLGIDRTTVILVTSDNGSTWGEHRLYAQAKRCPYEECLRVPMIVHDGRTSGGHVYDIPVLTIDIAPTVAELAGIEPPAPTDGASFASWIAGSPTSIWRDDFLIEHWRSNRNDTLRYRGQVTDGDQVRVIHGDTRDHPRPSVLFEFDAGGGVAGAVAVPIGADADASFASLGAAMVAAVPNTARDHAPAFDTLQILDNSPDHSGVYLVVERDQNAAMIHPYAGSDWFGVRDVRRGFTYVAHESGELELYDLHVDPAQLENKAADPAYATIRRQLALRLADLVQ